MDYLRANYRKVLKVLGVLVVISLIGFVIAYFLENKADISEFEITNLSSNSLTLSWSSENSYIASVQYSDSDNWLPIVDKVLPKNQAYDDRDLLLNENNVPEYSSVKAFPRNYHHVTIRNLEAGKQYYFRINGNLRTFIPTINTATTLNQAEKVAEPDPVYGKVINYAADGDNPTDGIVYYKLIDLNDKNNVSARYSTTIGPDSGWSGDLSNLTKPDGTTYKWDKENFKIDLETRSNEGYGWNTLSLAQYKPLEDAVVNVRYISADSVLGASTESNVLGISTVHKVSAGSAIVNGVPICQSGYSESCGDNCSRDVSCGPGGSFRAGSCNCKADTSTPPGQTSKTQPTCPVATIWNGSICASTAADSKKDATTAVPPSVGGGDKVADKPAKPNDPKTRDEANKQVPVGAKKSSTGAAATVPSSCTADLKSTTTIHNSTEVIAGLYCNTCLHTTDGRKAIANNTTYVCRDPAKGWELESEVNSCPSEYTGCPLLSCGSGTYSSENDRAYCTYGTNSRANIGTCTNKVVNNSYTNNTSLELIACGGTSNTSCKAGLDSVICPSIDHLSCSGETPVTLTGSRTQSSTSVDCVYLYGTSGYTLRMSCDPSTGIVDNNVPDMITPICNDYNSKNVNVDQPIVPDTTGANVTVSNCTGTLCRSAAQGGSGDGYVECRDPGTNNQNFCKDFSPADTVDSPSPCPHGPDGTGDSPSCGPQDATHTYRCSSNVDGTYKYCTTGPEGSLLNPVKKVYAQPIPEVIDPVLLSKGTYRIVIPGYKNAEFSILNNKVNIKYFQDDNSDGIKQASEKYIDVTSFQVTVSKLSDLSTYNLQSGWNLIALNFISSDLDQASELSKVINKQGVAAVQISKYDSGNWVHYVYRINDAGSEEDYGNDFKLIPGESYFVRALSPGVVSLKGQKYTSSVPINLNNGWNLTAILSPIDYTAKSFIEACKKQGAQCTTISRLDSGIYESVVEFENKFFGNNFDLKDTEGYFVLNKSANKTISP